MRITLDVADVSRFHPMLCHKPELVSHTSIAHWRASWLPRLPSLRFEQRISRQRQTHRQRELNWRVEQVFLKCANDAMLHFVLIWTAPDLRLEGCSKNHSKAKPLL